jgi:hypothetical protein
VRTNCGGSSIIATALASPDDERHPTILSLECPLAEEELYIP